MADLTNQQLLDAIAQMFVDMNERLDRHIERSEKLRQEANERFERHQRESDKRYEEAARRHNKLHEEFNALHQEGHVTERRLETLRSGVAKAAHAAQ